MADTFMLDDDEYEFVTRGAGVRDATHNDSVAAMAAGYYPTDGEKSANEPNAVADMVAPYIANQTQHSTRNILQDELSYIPVIGLAGNWAIDKRWPSETSTHRTSGTEALLGIPFGRAGTFLQKIPSKLLGKAGREIAQIPKGVAKKIQKRLNPEKIQTRKEFAEINKGDIGEGIYRNNEVLNRQLPQTKPDEYFMEPGTGLRKEDDTVLNAIGDMPRDQYIEGMLNARNANELRHARLRASKAYGGQDADAKLENIEKALIAKMPNTSPINPSTGLQEFATSDVRRAYDDLDRQYAGVLQEEGRITKSIKENPDGGNAKIERNNFSLNPTKQVPFLTGKYTSADLLDNQLKSPLFYGAVPLARPVTKFTADVIGTPKTEAPYLQELRSVPTTKPEQELHSTKRFNR